MHDYGSCDLCFFACYSEDGPGVYTLVHIVMQKDTQ